MTTTTPPSAPSFARRPIVLFGIAGAGALCLLAGCSYNEHNKSMHGMTGGDTNMSTGSGDSGGLATGNLREIQRADTGGTGYDSSYHSDIDRDGNPLTGHKHR